MPEHFLALIKQYANLSSNSEAERIALQLSEALQLTLSEDSKKLFFTYAPDYLLPKKPRFFTKVFDWNKSYQHETLIERLQLLQHLNDKVEAENRLRAYFTAVRIVSGKKAYYKIFSILPPELQTIA